MRKCKDCPHFTVVYKPDKLAEGLAKCDKYNLSVDLFKWCYKSQLEKLECVYKEETT